MQGKVMRLRALEDAVRQIKLKLLHLMPPFWKLVGKHHIGPVARPVSFRGAGDEALLHKVCRVGKNRQVIGVNHEPRRRAARHLESVPEEADASYISDRMDSGVARKIGADAVQQRRRCDKLGVGVRRERALLERRQINPTPLVQDEHITWFGIAVAAQFCPPTGDANALSLGLVACACFVCLAGRHLSRRNPCH